VDAPACTQHASARPARTGSRPPRSGRADTTKSPRGGARAARGTAISIVPMGLQRFERRLERLVEGAFGKAFRSGLQPVEIGRRIAREMDAGRTLGVRGTVVPNHFTVTLSVDDTERFAGFSEALAHELTDAAREHAREEGYGFEGPVEV